MGKYMETGEMGFCPVCGTTSEVVVLPDDRLQKRIAKLVEQIVHPYIEKDRTADQLVRYAFMEIRDVVEAPYGRDVKTMLVTLQGLLVMAAEAQGEVIDEEIDLMRLTAETLEAIRG
jgi:isocitrate dehydrogenase